MLLVLWCLLAPRGTHAAGPETKHDLIAGARARLAATDEIELEEVNKRKMTGTSSQIADKLATTIHAAVKLHDGFAAKGCLSAAKGRSRTEAPTDDGQGSSSSQVERITSVNASPASASPQQVQTHSLAPGASAPAVDADMIAAVQAAVRSVVREEVASGVAQAVQHELAATVAEAVRRELAAQMGKGQEAQS